MRGTQFILFRQWKRPAIAAAFWSICSLAALAEPSIRALKISAEEAPEIDGNLSDEVWKKAAMISDLTQMYPTEQVAPSEKTEIRICYDSRNLYVSFRCFDSDPEKVNASIMQRDQTVGSDDYVFVLLDPYQTGRDGFYFRLNGNGGKGDGRITAQSSRPNMDWDAIWDGAGQLDDLGYATEMAIPFRSVSFDASSTVWNVNFGRSIPRKNERIRWSGAYRSRKFHKLENAGKLTGLSGMERGRGIDLKPFFLGGHSDTQPDKGYLFDYGADIFWQATPSLTATFTYNTDFAESEVDDRQVNLSRFPLFFPEKRDFFLEGQEYFEFGPYSTSLRPFHSRNIGLSDTREIVDIIGGAKVAGRIGKLGVGVMANALDESGNLQSDEMGVARLTYDVFEQSRVGTFFSYGDARGNNQNWVGGVDFDYKNTNWNDTNKEVSLKLYELMSQNADQSGHAFGALLDYPNKPFRYRIGIRQIDRDFRPGLGFVRRPGTRRYFTYTDYEFLLKDSKHIRDVSVSTTPMVTTNLEDIVETVDWEVIEIEANFRSGDEISISPTWNREVIFAPFEIFDGISIPVGCYDFPDISGGIETSSHRPVSVELYGKFGEFWNGHRWGVDSEIEWRQSKYFGVQTGADFDDVTLPNGDFDVLVGYAGFRVTPNPNLSWNTLAQWDNVSNNVGLNSRVRYIVAPGNDVFFVINQGYNVTDNRSFVRTGSDVTAKLGWTFRF